MDIGFASRKLGRYHDAKVWYASGRSRPIRNTSAPGSITECGISSRATGSRAQDHLEQIRIICRDNPCKEFDDLKDALDGNMIY